MSTSEIISERSALTYTLLTDELKWDEFSLIVRSLHSYKVISFDESPESKTITVNVAYFANAKNARQRLGRASDHIEVSRESSFVQREELQTLQQLRRRLGFGGHVDDEEPSTSKSHAKKRRYGSGH